MPRSWRGFLYTVRVAAKDISGEIERLSALRQRAWKDGDGLEAKRLSERLNALYDDKRCAVASHGTPAQREKAKKRAVAEKELDRLMQAT